VKHKPTNSVDEAGLACAFRLSIISQINSVSFVAMILHDLETAETQTRPSFTIHRRTYRVLYILQRTRQHLPEKQEGSCCKVMSCCQIEDQISKAQIFRRLISAQPQKNGRIWWVSPVISKSRLSVESNGKRFRQRCPERM
jgi:hypothetical protein